MKDVLFVKKNVAVCLISLYHLAQAEQYYNNQINLSDLGFENLEWVFYGPYEQLLGPEFRPPPNLELAYQDNGVVIYKAQGE